MNFMPLVAGVSGILTLLFAFIFIYYSYKNALVLKDSLGKYLTALGSFFFMMPGFIDGIRVSGAGLQDALRVLSFLLFFTGFILMLNGGVISFFSIYKETKEKTWLNLLKVQPNGGYLLFGFFMLIFIAFPFYILSLMTEVRTFYGWAGMMGILLGYTSLAIGEKKLFSKLTISSSIKDLPEEKLLFLKEEIYTLRLFNSLANDYLEKIEKISGSNNLKKFISSDELSECKLFNSNSIKSENVKFSEKRIRAKLKSIDEEEKKEVLFSDFSKLLESLVDYLGRSASIKFAKSELKESFEDIKSKAGENPTVFEMLRCLPEGVIKEERYSLLSRKELESKVKKRTAELENILDTMVDMLIKINHDGTIELANDSVYRILGYEEEDVIGSKPDKIFSEEDEQEENEQNSSWKDIQQKIYDNGFLKDYETYFKTSDGEKIPISFSGSRMDLKETNKIEKPSIVCVGKDIRERKKAEERADFLHSLLRHDLGNKLQITLGFLELIKDSDISEELDGFVENSLTSIEEGMELIDNIRTLNKLEDGEKGEEPVNLKKSIEESIKRHRDLAEKLDFNVISNVEEKKMVEGGLLLKELFSNLIENSLKHSEGDILKITDYEEKGKVRVVIEDDGKGIPEKLKDKITKKGFQGEDSSGSGLGMYLVKRITESYNGDFLIKDSELGGAKFEVVLYKYN